MNVADFVDPQFVRYVGLFMYQYVWICDRTTMVFCCEASSVFTCTWTTRSPSACLPNQRLCVMQCTLEP